MNQEPLGKPQEMPQEPLLPNKRDSKLSTMLWLLKTMPMMLPLPTKRNGTMQHPESI
jgi:hypothetical protein